MRITNRTCGPYVFVVDRNTSEDQTLVGNEYLVCVGVGAPACVNVKIRGEERVRGRESPSILILTFNTFNRSITNRTINTYNDTVVSRLV